MLRSRKLSGSRSMTLWMSSRSLSKSKTLGRTSKSLRRCNTCS